MAGKPVELVDEREPPEADEDKRAGARDDPAAGRDSGQTDPDGDLEPEPEAPHRLKDTTMKW